MRVLVNVVPKTVAMVYRVVNPSSPLLELAHPACSSGQQKGRLAKVLGTHPLEKAHAGPHVSGVPAGLLSSTICHDLE